MTALGPISPFFIVADLARAVRFYETIGFDLQLSLPAEDPFFAIVGRDAVRILLKEIGSDVAPQPNHTLHDWAMWDAYIDVDDPDALAAEFGTEAADRDDGLRGFELRDADGYTLYFGRPK